MPIFVAYSVIDAINAGIEQDGGATYRGFLREEITKISDAYDTDTFPFRKHLGASVIGKECDRAIWYGWRWAKKPNFPPRLLRLFNRGHIEEARFSALLRAAGIPLYQFDSQGKQLRISGHGGHYGGALDGIVPYAPEYNFPLLSEFKTHHRKSFEALAGDNWEKHLADRSGETFRGLGVREVKPEHYAQMQQYCRFYSLAGSLYFAVHKDTDSIYVEVVPRDDINAEAFFSRAGAIITARTAPRRISNVRTNFKCKFCDFREICHGKEVPLRNCRTCEYSQPVDEGNWYCSAHCKILSKEEQLAGCTAHALSHLFR